jgi:ABC-2 type transport system permease protein
LLARKLVVGLLLSAVAVVLVPISGLIAGTVAFGWGDVTTPFGVLPAATAIGRLVVIVAYLAWTSVWLAALAFALSTTTDSAVGAVAGAIVLVIVVQILDAIDALGDIRRWLPVHEGNAWIGLLATPARYADLSRGIWLQLPYLVVFLGFAWWSFSRRDVLS